MMEKVVISSMNRRPIKEAMMEAPPRSQKLSNLSHILFHLACEFPFFPSSAMNTAAFTPPDINPTVICSSQMQPPSLPFRQLKLKYSVKRQINYHIQNGNYGQAKSFVIKFWSKYFHHKHHQVMNSCHSICYHKEPVSSLLLVLERTHWEKPYNHPHIW